MNTSSKAHSPGALFAALLIFCTPVFVQAARIGDLIIDNADTMERDAVAQTIKLSGHVRIIYRDQYLNTEQATVFMQSKEIEAKGRTTLVSPTIFAEGESILMNYEKDTGVIYNGFVQMGQVSFEGKIIYRTGPQTFEAIDGLYTSCTTCPPSWSFTGTKVTGTFGGSATIRNPIFRVAGLPILWLPYLVVPLNSKRQTGLLYPGFEAGETSGLTVSESFYWVMADNKDSTWTLKNYEKRGQKGMFNYRYVLSPTSWGELDSAFIRDKVFVREGRIPADQQGGKYRNRWMGRYRQYFDLPEGYIYRAEANLASDHLYGRDFPSEVNTAGEPALVTRTSITKNFPRNHLSVDFDYYTNQLKFDPLEDNRDAVHAFPFVRYTHSPTSVLGTNLLLDVDAHYVNYTRDGRVYDNVERKLDGTLLRITDRSYEGSIKHKDDGSGNEIVDPSFIDSASAFDPDHDIIRAGQRFDFQPRLTYPIHAGKYLDLLPSLAYRETRYQFNIGSEPTAERRLIRGRMAARTSFTGYYGDMESQTAPRYKHEVRPELSYTNVPWLSQDDSSFFGRYRNNQSTNEPNFNLEDPVNNSDVIQFDYLDRLYDRNIATASITQTLTRRTWSGGEPSYKQIALFRVSQSYDIYEEQRTTENLRLPYSIINALLDIRLQNFDTNTSFNYYPYHNLTSFSSRARIYANSGAYIESTLSQDYTILKEKYLAGINRTENQSLATGFSTKYLSLAAATSYSWVVHEFRDWSYNMIIRPPGDCWAISIGYQRAFQQPEGLYSFNFNLNYGAGQSHSIGF